MRTHFGLATLVAAAFTMTSAHAASVIVDVNVNAVDAASLQSTVDDFRNSLGVLNPNDPVNGDPFGRRQINWDAAPDAISDPNPFPGDFFNFNASPRARGIEFEATGDTTGFLLSSTAASGQPTAFGFSNDFTTFSEERLFTPVGGTTFDVNFFDPSDQTTEAATRGLGIVFSDVEKNGTTISFFDRNGGLLETREAKRGKNGSLTFVGLIFDAFVVGSVQVNAGNAVILGNGSIGPGSDGVVMDDFIFGEPVAVIPLPPALLLLVSGIAGLGIISLRRRREEA